MFFSEIDHYKKKQKMFVLLVPKVPAKKKSSDFIIIDAKLCETSQVGWMQFFKWQSTEVRILNKTTVMQIRIRR